MLIAIGGGRLKSSLRAPEFLLRSALSMRQARRHPGNLFAGVNVADGMMFSLTAWESPVAMKEFARKAEHLNALQSCVRLTEWYRFHHYLCRSTPVWDDALTRWRDMTFPRSVKEGLEIVAVPQ